MVLGIADEFTRRGLSIFCPSRAAAELEGSKAFARDFMERHKIPSPGIRHLHHARRGRGLRQEGALRLPRGREGRRPRLGQGHDRRPGRGGGPGGHRRDDGGQEVRNGGLEARHGGVPPRRGGLVPRLLRRLPGRADGVGPGPQAHLRRGPGAEHGGHGNRVPGHQPLRRRPQADHAGHRPAHDQGDGRRRGAAIRVCSTWAS